jgi:NAD(P)H-flavin reductase
VEGPFGARHENYKDFNSLTIVAGGTGMAALYPFIKELSLTGKRIDIYWVCRYIDDVVPYVNLFELLNSTRTSGKIHLNLYVTRLNQNDTNLITQVVYNNEIVFKKKENNITQEGRFVKNGKYLSNWSIIHAILAIVVFGGFAGGYALGRILQFDFNMDYCMSDDAVLSTGLTHFLCWYWYYWGPFIFCPIFAITFGIFWIFVISFTEQKAPEGAIVEVVSPISEADLRESWNISPIRPVWDSCLVRNDNEVKAILAAGPESMMRDVENISIKNGVSFFRESWKV